MGKMDQFLTTTKHNKPQTMCIILGTYCGHHKCKKKKAAKNMEVMVPNSDGLVIYMHNDSKFKE